MVGIRSVDAGLLELARSLRATRRQVLTDPRGPGGAAVDPRRAAGRRDARRRRRDRRRVGRRRARPRRPRQPRPRQPVRHPADVRDARHDRAARDRSAISSSSSSSAASSAFASPAWRSHAPVPSDCLAAPLAASRRGSAAASSSAGIAGPGARRRRRRLRRPRADAADGRPRLHPERPVRAVLPRRPGRLLREAGLDVTFQNEIDAEPRARRSARARSTSAWPTGRA